jgi:hypothetical protein
MNPANRTEKPNTPLFDRFDLNVQLLGADAAFSDKARAGITQSVLINGKNIAPTHSIDWVDLSKSCQLSGKFFIATCGCGVPACAGIYDGIRVTHFDDRIVWEIPEPLSYNGLSDDEGDQIALNRVYKQFSFEPLAYLRKVQEGLRIAKGYLFGDKQPVECSPYGMTPERLLALDPIVFSERGATVGFQVVGRNIQILDGLYWITINGIDYRLHELPISDDIKALNNWSDWEPKPCEGGFVFGPLAAPEHEVRRRVRLLAQHLTTVACRGTEINVSDRLRPCKDGSRIDRRILLRGQLPYRSSTGGPVNRKRTEERSGCHRRFANSDGYAFCTNNCRQPTVCWINCSFVRSLSNPLGNISCQSVWIAPGRFGIWSRKRCIRPRCTAPEIVSSFPAPGRAPTVESSTTTRDCWENWPTKPSITCGSSPGEIHAPLFATPASGIKSLSSTAYSSAGITRRNPRWNSSWNKGTDTSPTDRRLSANR